LCSLRRTTNITSRRYIVEEAITFRDMPRASDSELVETASKLSSSLPSRTAIER
jgi:hypothetical protein